MFCSMYFKKIDWFCEYEYMYLILDISEIRNRVNLKTMILHGQSTYVSSLSEFIPKMNMLIRTNSDV